MAKKKNYCLQVLLMKLLIPCAMTFLAARTFLLGFRGSLVRAADLSSSPVTTKSATLSKFHHYHQQHHHHARSSSSSFRGGSQIGDTTEEYDSNDNDDDESTHYFYRTLQVQIVHRHGDRTPITPLKDEEYWAQTLVSPDLLDKISSNTQVITDGQPLTHLAGGRGPFGKLTQLGLFQLVDLGTQLREELMSPADHHDEDVQFYTPTTTTTHDGDNNNNNNKAAKHWHFRYPWHAKRPLHPKNIKIISTNFPRTIQSAQGLLVGLFPDGTPQTIPIDARHTDILIPDPQPRRSAEQEALEAQLARQPHLQLKEEEMRPLAIRATQALLDCLGEGALDVSFGVGEEQDSQEQQQKQPRLAWGQLAEITKCLLVRNRLPPTLTPDDQEIISNYTAWRWFESLRHPRLAFLAMNPMVTRILDAMHRHDKEPPVIIYSAHDSTLIGLLCGFRLEQPTVWPEYASYLKIELIEVTTKTTSASASATTSSSSPKEHIVRFSLNGQLLRVVWDPKEPPMAEIPLKLLAHKLKTVGSVAA